MSVHQTKDGRWFVRYPKGTIPHEPNRTREYFGRGEDARERAERRNLELGFGKRVLNGEGKTFTSIANYYLQAKTTHIQKRSIDTAYMHVEKHLTPFFGKMQAESITEKDLDNYVTKRATSKWKAGGDKGQERTGVSRSTIKRELTTFQAIMNFAAKRKEILHNPCLYYDMPKEDDQVIAAATVGELQAILRVAPDHLQRFVLIAYYTAVRTGYTELLTMRWDQIDFSGETIFVVSARKGGLSSRRIDMHPELKDHLLRWLADDKKRTPMPEYIVHYRGKHIKKVDKAWKNAKNKANILRRLRTYDIRHASITNMLESGADLKAVSLTAGHKNPAMTMRKYQHVSSKLKREAIGGLKTLGNSGNKSEKVISLKRKAGA